MVKENEITSTEKLLDVIRGTVEDPAADPFNGNRLSERRLSKGTSLRRSLIGVDIGRTNIKLVKMDAKRRVKDFALIPLDSRLTVQGPEFQEYFRSVLKGFIGRDGKYQLWAALSSSQAELSYLKVPKVPAAQLANVILLSFRREFPFSDQERVFDFSVLGEVTEAGAKKVEVMAYSVPRETVERTKRLFAGTGCALTGLTVYPFALQNLFRSSWVTAGAETYCCLLLGMNWSRIDIFRDGDLMMSRGIKTGANSMIQAVASLLGPRPGSEDDFLFESDEADLQASAADHEQTELASRLFFKLADRTIKDDQPLFETEITKKNYSGSRPAGPQPPHPAIGADHRTLRPAHFRVVRGLPLFPKRNGRARRRPPGPVRIPVHTTVRLLAEQ